MQIIRLGAIVPWIALLVVVPEGPAAGQLTLQDNFLLDEADFDTAEPFNNFGAALARCDFDGDGYPDLAIGSPRADLLVVEDAGKVHVAYGGPLGLTVAGHQTVVQPLLGEDPPTEDGRFGEAVAGGDFDGDGDCDLAVGRPSASFNGLTEAGLVHVFEGTPSGLDTSESALWWQDQTGIADDSESDDRFGASLAAADFNGDGFDDLVIGVPFEDSGAGAVHVLFGTAGGLASGNDDFIAQGDALGTVGTAEPGDRFGAVLAIGQFDDGDTLPDLAISAPLEDTASVTDGGWVQVFFPNQDRFLDRSSRQLRFELINTGQTPADGDTFGLSLAAGDFDGDGLDELAIGSEKGVSMPGDRAGSVTVLVHGPTGVLAHEGALLFTQDTAGVSDAVEANDVFGGALAAGDFDGDRRDDLAVGVPNENFEGGGFVNNGALHVLYGSAAGLGTEGEQFHGQGVWGAGATESGDFFGEELVAADFDDDGVWALAIGVPREDRAAGADAGILVMITGEHRPIFTDGFETGDTSAWDATLP